MAKSHVFTPVISMNSKKNLDFSPTENRKLSSAANKWLQAGTSRSPPPTKGSLSVRLEK